ncbi:hypothetical protein [Oryza sativa Japonica Group]|uniref:Uncharacterized protein n=1 Tax=Oryza sativa subsp. japonica TaxID=39947 RepID=Q5ZDV9_ORYSJ|nr:hypothetical protein [Oryza sativa Japonica Group]BAD52569.1 hypothetical protein [Oryza sativa Japonica Group]
MAARDGTALKPVLSGLSMKPVPSGERLREARATAERALAAAERGGRRPRGGRRQPRPCLPRRPRRGLKRRETASPPPPRPTPRRPPARGRFANGGDAASPTPFATGCRRRLARWLAPQPPAGLPKEAGMWSPCGSHADSAAT